MVKNILNLLLVGLVCATIASASAAAHATIYTPDNKIRFVYGSIGEPVYTFQKTGLDLGIFDNATGAPLTGYHSIDHGQRIPPKLTVKYRYGGEGGPELDLSQDLTASFGRPGWYTYPMTFTRPGLYYLVISGNINGTQVDQVLAPNHEIPAMTDIMWPAEFPLPDSMQARITELETEVNALKNDRGGGSAPGIEAAMLLGLAALVALALRRRAA